MFESCLAKQQQVKALFEDCATEEDKYARLIELGRQQQALNPLYKTSANLVEGCQSQLWLHAYTNDKSEVIFETEADALISAGLAALLVKVYSGETPETILKCPPTYLDELGIHTSLSPNRANGLYSAHLRMKREALRLLTEKTYTN